MEEVIEYLQMKNHYYEKFYEITKRFLDKANQDNWQDLDFFVDNRDRLLNIIRSLEYKIARAFKDAENHGQDIEAYKETVQRLLIKRKEIGERIVALDLELIAKIDELKSDTIQELKKTVETQNQIDVFTKTLSTRKSNRIKEA